MADGGVAGLDLELVTAIACGDRDALARLYDVHSPVMLAIGHRILRRGRDAEDVLHDVFVEVWKHAGEYDPRRGSVKTWLMLRMRSRCLDRVRSAGVARVEPIDDREFPELPVEESTEGARDRARVRAALDELPADQRAVLELGYFEGLSCSEMADRLGIPIGTVKSRVAAALGKLRDAMAVEEDA